MRDDRHKWAPFSQDEVFEFSNETRLIRVQDLRQTMISGSNVRAQLDLPIIGWPDIAARAPYAVSLRRDRILLVGASARTDGWDDEAQQAVSDLSHGFSIFDLSGPNALSMLKQGAEISLELTSQSTMRILFGLGLYLYRYNDADTFRFHVPRHQAEAFIGHLKSVAE